MSNVEKPTSSYGFAIYVLVGSVGFAIGGPRLCATCLAAVALLRLIIAHVTGGEV